MSFSSRLKERRESLGITQVQLAQMLGVTKGAVGNYETGLSSPKAEILYKVFDVLKCDANYLFQDEMACRNTSLGNEHDMSIKNDETSLIKKYRRLNDSGKEYIDTQLDYALSQAKYMQDGGNDPAGCNVAG